MNYSRAAEWLGVSVNTLKRLVKAGRIYPIRINRRVLFTEDILKAFNEKCASGKPVRRVASKSSGSAVAAGSRREW